MDTITVIIDTRNMVHLTIVRLSRYQRLTGIEPKVRNRRTNMVALRISFMALTL